MIPAKANPLCYALAPIRSWVFDVELGALHAQKSHCHILRRGSNADSEEIVPS